MHLPRSASRFAFGCTGCFRATVALGAEKWIVFASRGIRYVVIRASHRDRPWLCHRVSVRTDQWDRANNIDREDYIMGFLRRLQRPAQGALDRPDALDPHIAEKFPALHEYLVRTRDDEGKVRQTCSLTVYGHLGRFKGFLNDRDSGASLGVDADSIQGLLAALEGELESESPSWFWRDNGRGQGGKKGGKGA